VTRRAVSADDAPDPDRLGDEQSAVRRIATRGVSPAGAFAAVSRQRLRPAGAEERLADFSELAGTAIANAESRAELMASRARTVSAADEARHRIQRDLHDGAQQRVVTLAVKLKMLAASDVAGVSGLDADVLELVSDVEDALSELRGISRPEVLSVRRWC
jgi:signal transduction histidine kinase